MEKCIQRDIKEFQEKCVSGEEKVMFYSIISPIVPRSLKNLEGVKIWYYHKELWETTMRITVSCLGK